MESPLYSLIKEYENKPKNGLSSKIRNDDVLKNEVLSLTQFLDTDSPLSARIYCILNNILVKPICTCGKQLKFHKINRGFYKTCGNKDCVHKLTSLNSTIQNKKKDWELINKKREETCIKKYGGTSNLSKGTYSREYADEKMIQSIGTKHALQNKECKQKSIDTTLSRYGTLNMLGLDKVKSTIKSKYGVDHPMKNNEVKLKSAQKQILTKYNDILDRLPSINCSYVSHINDKFNLKCNKCGTNISDITRQLINYTSRNNSTPCHKCSFHNHFRSNGEKSLVEEIRKFYIGDIQLNRKHLGMEADIIIPDKKLIIEYNGLYWHSELYKSKTHHIDKKKHFESKGYNTIYIWEDDWCDVLKRAIILNRLKVKLDNSKKVGARECIIKEISGKESKQFLNTYHLRGYCPSKINLGLYYKGELVSITTFREIRNLIGSKSYNGYELLRNCTKDNFLIIGGLSKCISYFQKKFKASLYSYADLDWTSLSNSSYIKSNFKLLKISDPGYWWVDKGLKKNRLNYTKGKLIKEGHDSNLTEIEIMHSLKCYRVFNCGNAVYYKSNNSDKN